MRATVLFSPTRVSFTKRLRKPLARTARDDVSGGLVWQTHVSTRGTQSYPIQLGGEAGGLGMAAL